MIRRCDICGQIIQDGEVVHVGVVSVYKALPSQSSWAIEKPERYTFVNHASCDEVESV